MNPYSKRSTKLCTFTYTESNHVTSQPPHLHSGVEHYSWIFMNPLAQRETDSTQCKIQSLKHLILTRKSFHHLLHDEFCDLNVLEAHDQRCEYGIVLPGLPNNNSECIHPQAKRTQNYTHPHTIEWTYISSNVPGEDDLSSSRTLTEIVKIINPNAS